ncbi:MAG: xanthine dehydrogenase family protein molybdopterin-binding subunit [Myxococcales bacterium FL481]|nr:MAG: xanthine dehydrogenase family protein molybdopterin-binding subunit [Myxococcales bacterium FL481]
MKQHRLKVGFSQNYRQAVVTTPDDEPRPWDADSQLTQVGKPTPRIDGVLKVTGAAKYTFDIALPGMLFAAVLRCPHPCAKLVALDLQPAERAEGVRAVLAVAEIGDRLLYAGQDVAAVAATSATLAREALAEIVATFEPLPFVVDPSRAQQPDAPAVHQGAVQERRTEGDEPGEASAAKRRGNTRPGRSQKRGQAAKGLRRAHTVFEATYTTAVQTHSALESHGLVVRWDGPKAMTAWASTQSIFSTRRDLADMFDLEANQVRVITEYMGGGFGGKFGANAPGSSVGWIAASLARKAQAPVKLMCQRDEEHLVGGNRPDSRQRVRLGADSRGRLVAVHVQASGTAGIATGAGVGRNAFGIYSRCPNTLVESLDVFTNAGPSTAFRAPGHPQGAFAIESALDELALALGQDPVDIRLANDGHPVRRYQLELGRERFEWTRRREHARAQRRRNTRLRRGVGVASSIWGDYSNPGVVVTVVVGRDASIEVRNGVQDIGGGIGTSMALVAAEVFGRPHDRVRVHIGDSELGSGVGSGGSSTTGSVTPAVRNACEKARAGLLELAATKFGVAANKVQWEAGGRVRFGRQTLEFEELCKHISGDALVTTGSRPKTYASHPYAYPGSSVPQIAGVQFAEVEVDTWTGLVRCTQVLAIHDCGRVMNELTVRSQINGGVIGGVGYALFEERVMDNDLGVMVNANFEQYKIAGARDVPQIDIVLTQVVTGSNSTGAVGIGEPATIPTAAAIANATANALGVHVRSLPLTPRQVLAALSRPSPQGAA